MPEFKITWTITRRVRMGSAEEAMHAADEAEIWGGPDAIDEEERTHQVGAVPYCGAWLPEPARTLCEAADFGIGGNLRRIIGDGSAWACMDHVTFRIGQAATEEPDHAGLAALLAQQRPPPSGGRSAAFRTSNERYEVVGLAPGVWLQRGYAELVEAIFPGCAWHSGGAEGPAHAVVDGRTVALVMPVTGGDAL